MTLSEWLNKIPWTATSNRTITVDFDALEKLFESREALVEALEAAKDKIRAYQKAYGNEYVGGPLLQTLMPKIETALILAKGEPK